MTTTTPLRGISEIRAFFRTNQTPIYFVSPTAFNLLGIDRWVRNCVMSDGRGCQRRGSRSAPHSAQPAA